MLGALLVVAAAFGVDALPPHEILPTAKDAAAYAAQDLLTVKPPQSQVFYRYLWLQKPTKLKVAAVVYTLNTISRSSLVFRPTVLHGGALIRVDLRALAPREEEFNQVRDTWEELAATNFYFNNIRTVSEEVVKEVKPAETKTEKVLVDDGPPRYDQYGRSVQTKKWVEKQVTVAAAETKKETKQIVVSEFALGTPADMGNILLLHSLTGQSKAPILKAEQFVILALSQLNGGKYYQFVGVRKSTLSGRSDLDQFLIDHGVDPKDIERLRSDERIAMFQSAVTGKPRRVEFWNGAGVRATVGAGLVTISNDVQDGNFDPKQHPIKSLASKKTDAIEVIVMKANGGLVFAIFNGAGALAQVVPDNIAVDFTIPNGFTKPLEPALSCIACHLPSDGFIQAPNDVQKLLRSFQKTPNQILGLKVYDDEQSRLATPELLEQVAAWFGGDAERTAFRQARNDHSRAFFTALGGVSVAEAGAELVRIRNDYQYLAVSPREALKDLGYETDREADAVKIFNSVVPFTPGNRFGVHTEDPVVAALRTYDARDPIRIRRFDWEPIINDVYVRMLTKRAADKLSKP